MEKQMEKIVVHYTDGSVREVKCGLCAELLEKDGNFYIDILAQPEDRIELIACMGILASAAREMGINDKLIDAVRSDKDGKGKRG